MKVLYTLIGLFLFCSCLTRAEDKSLLVSQKETNKSSNAAVKPKEIDYDSYFKQAQLFTKANNYNQDFFFLIDLGKHSGLKRFFVYDFKKNKIVKSYMVSHGCGDAAWGGEMNKENAPISNVADSHCSSIGKYMISSRGVSQWGIKVNYLLMGKDKTNSNALSRAIVLHSWNAIPDDEIYPNGTPEGWGCPAVSNESMKEIDEMLKVNKRVLMWIIKSS
ncbi:murein L,D-transpeptidase catalytic domain-containing protein [Flavobacterium artemisiae]|uniref:Murein L,D-transpeptidase catalytic domain-containing protein n=1 Tax=Flavobacterium artemisiae TaxID=2126556 RepID=A0ABW4HEP6_9FLAO